MKSWIDIRARGATVISGVLLAIACLGGCVSAPSNSQSPTNDATHPAGHAAMVAEAVEEHMGAKYGLPFRSVSVAADDGGAGNNSLVTVEPKQGEFAGRDFTVYVNLSPPTGPVFMENYFRAVRNDEYAAYVEGLLEDAAASCPHDVRVCAELAPSLVVDDRFDGKTAVADVVASCDGRVSVVFAPSSDMDEDAYKRGLSGILDAACGVNPSLFYEACYVEELEPVDGVFDAATAMSYLYTTDEDRRGRCAWRTYGRVSDGVVL